MSWQDAFQEKQNIVLASASREGTPHAIIVMSLGLVENKLLIGVCQMKKTLDNLEKNNQVALVAQDKDGYYRIEGTCEIYTSGEYLNIALTKSSPPLPKSAILITINSVYDLDKVTKIA